MFRALVFLFAGSVLSDICDFRSDLVFVLEGGSNTIRQREFSILQGFLVSTLATAVVGPGHTRVGLVTFGSEEATTVFDLNELGSVEEVDNAIQNAVQHADPKLDTSTALTNAIIAAQYIEGTRSNSTKAMVILIKEFDGNYQALVTASRSAKSAGWKIHVIQMENENPTNLERISSGSEFYFAMPDVDSVTRLLAPDAGFVCYELPYSRDDQTEDMSSETDALTCGADIVYIFDASDSMTDELFEAQKTFAGDCVLATDERFIRFASVTFGEEAEINFGFADADNDAEVMQEIDQIEKVGGLTNIEAGILKALELEEAESVSFATVMIIVSDGIELRGNALEAISIAKDLGWLVYCVGVGLEIDWIFLGELASDPSADYLYDITTLEVVGMLDPIREFCAEGEIEVLPPVLCERQIDLVFVQDHSGSITFPDYNELSKIFMSDVVSTLHVAPDRAQIGTVIFGDFASIEFPLGRYNSNEEVLDAIVAIDIMDCSMYEEDNICNTNLADGIRQARNIAGTRRLVQKVMIIMTDGDPNREVESTVEEANIAKENGWLVIAIGIGDVETEFLENLIVSAPRDPDDKFFFYFEEWENLEELLDPDRGLICDE